MFQESPETNSTVFSHAIENSSKFNQVFSISNHTSNFIFKAEKLNWTYSTFPELLYTFPRADVSNKIEAEEEQTFISVICPGQQGLQWLGISQLKREDNVLCSRTFIISQLAPSWSQNSKKPETGMPWGVQDLWHKDAAAQTNHEKTGKGRWTHLDGKETW